MRFCVDLLRQPVFKDMVGHRTTPTDQDLASDQALDTWLQLNAGIAGHSSLTCGHGSEVRELLWEVQGVDDPAAIPRWTPTPVFWSAYSIGLCSG